VANKTVQDIYGMADDLLRQDGNSSGVPGLEETRTISWVDMLHRAFFDEFTNSGSNYPIYMRKHDGDTMVATSTVAADFLAGASSFTIDSSTALGTSGAGVIYKNYQFDIFTHSGNSSGTVSGVSGVDFDHDEDEIVSKLYPLASDFGRMRVEGTGETRHEGVRVNGLGYSQTPDMPSYRQYSLWQNPTDGAWYLWLPYVTSGDILTVYDQKPTNLTATTSTIDIPTQYADHMYLVWGLVALFKQTLDDDYIATKERTEQLKYVSAALKRESTGRPLSASNAYFRRYGI
jgi:hypothetical protein